MEKKVAILQSNYIPWKGYFDLINSVDEFIFYDQAQYTKNDWRNRNLIKTAEGLQWLTIPVKTSGKFGQSINETKVANHFWADQHWKTISLNYAKAPYFKLYKDFFHDLYEQAKVKKTLSQVNKLFIHAIANILDIKTVVRNSEEFTFSGSKTEKLVSICKIAGASSYITGPAAINYLQVELFQKENIKVKWMDYSGYPEYPQLYPTFYHKVSIIDLLFNTGPSAKSYLKGIKG